MLKKCINLIVAVSFITSNMLVGGCASKSEDIGPAYVSPLQYSDYKCRQIKMEMQRVSRRVHEVAGVQDSEATGDSVALGVGLIVFWPALFFMIGKDKEDELARLKGEYEALETVAIQKECDIADEIEQQRKLREQKKEEEKAKQKGDYESLND